MAGHRLGYGRPAGASAQGVVSAHFASRSESFTPLSFDFDRLEFDGYVFGGGLSVSVDQVEQLQLFLVPVIYRPGHKEELGYHLVQNGTLFIRVPGGLVVLLGQFPDTLQGTL